MAVTLAKLKMFYLLEILREYTDEDHRLTAEQLREKMEQLYGETVERKTIYADVDTLTDAGFEIMRGRGHEGGFYLAEQEFTLPELKLLVDTVQSAKFLTAKKSEELIKKLSHYASKYQADELKRDVVIFNRAKTENEKTYIYVDSIHRAIRTNRQLAFKYTQLNMKKESVLRHGGKVYRISPLAMTWDDENYYLVAYDEDDKKIKHFRVDRMAEVNVLEDTPRSPQAGSRFDLAAFSKKTFGMYGGEDVKVTLLCRSGLVSVIVDRFGHDVMLIPCKAPAWAKPGEEYFRVHVPVAESPQFFGWLAGIGEGMTIMEPADVRKRYTAYLRKILERYSSES